jgi:hypothetical protein
MYDSHPADEMAGTSIMLVGQNGTARNTPNHRSAMFEPGDGGRTVKGVCIDGLATHDSDNRAQVSLSPPDVFSES